mmetsp:Transcript_12263/g.45643  ORF Transcript_12263/g.45643 Transcript_12263/m.45643 type:complete len:245 (-) Transcript_12263:2057-2791(-)
MVALIKTPTFYTPTFAFARSSTGSKMPAGTTSGSDAVSASGRVSFSFSLSLSFAPTFSLSPWIASPTFSELFLLAPASFAFPRSFPESFTPPASPSNSLISAPVSVSLESISALSTCRSVVCFVSNLVTRACESRKSCTTSLSTSASVFRRPPLDMESTCTGPTRDDKPTSPTMYVARRVACCKSESAPVVTSSLPKISSSATLPPMHTSSRAMSCFLVIDVSSLSGSCVTIPRALPLGTIVAL